MPDARVIGTVEEIRNWSRVHRRAGRRVALVPTMGYLHQGHLSLVELAREQADVVAMSIFVNPLQFGPGEDFDSYPRDLDRDAQLASDAGVDIIFHPGREEMYPDGEPWVFVSADQGTDALCGRFRLGHFRGVLTVVAKLFGAVEPDVAVFGRKDYQQLVLIERMVRDLNMGIEIIGAPLVREEDGLAMSSRNKYLSPEARRSALALSTALRTCQRMWQMGQRDADLFRAALAEIDSPEVRVQYAEVVDPVTLASVSEADQGTICAIAAHVDGTRLIDNVALGSADLA